MRVWSVSRATYRLNLPMISRIDNPALSGSALCVDACQGVPSHPDYDVRCRAHLAARSVPRLMVACDLAAAGRDHACRAERCESGFVRLDNRSGSGRR